MPGRYGGLIFGDDGANDAPVGPTLLGSKPLDPERDLERNASEKL